MTEHTRTVVIAGGTGYVGSAIARACASVGMRVVIGQRSGGDDALTKVLPESAGHAALSCDFTDPVQTERFFASAIADGEHCAAAVWAAGMTPVRTKLSRETPESYDEQIRSHATASFNFFSAALPRLERSQGRLIGITTAALDRPEEAGGFGSYLAGKAAMRATLRALAEELAGRVAVFEIAPGFMHGGMNASVPRAFAEIIAKKGATGRITDADEIARVVLERITGSTEAPFYTRIAPEIG